MQMCQEVNYLSVNTVFEAGGLCPCLSIRLLPLLMTAKSHLDNDHHTWTQQSHVNGV